MANTLMNYILLSGNKFKSFVCSNPQNSKFVIINFPATVH